MSSIRRGKLGGFLMTLALLGLAAPVTARADGPVVEPGYDLFTTLSGTRIAADLDGPGASGETVMSFASEPLGAFDFGDGPRDVGAADTVVRRFEAATPSDGLVPIELLALQLRSVEPVGYYATLQSDRGRHPLDPPDALASPGVIDIRFGPDGLGGTFHVEFLVNYDIRQGAADGPIVAVGSTRIQGDDGWRSAAPEEPQTTCHSAGGPLPLHQHCVVRVAGDVATLVCGETVSPIPAIPGVNSLLNGADESSDFHPGHSTDSAECGTGGGQTCELQSRSDQATTSGQQSGWLGGYFASGDPAEQVELGCAVQVDQPTHAGTDVVTESATGTGATVLARQVAYPLPAGSTVYVCTQVRLGGGTRYYYDAGTGEFSTSSAATCASSPVGRPPIPPVSSGICPGTGQLTLSAGLYYPVGPSVAASIVAFSFSGTCGSMTGTGTVSGHCNDMRGTFTLDGPFGMGDANFTAIGGGLIFTGEVSGTGLLTPAPGESCMPGGPGADTFNLAMALVG